MHDDIVGFSQDKDTVRVQSEMGCSSLVKSFLGCMQDSSHGLSDKDNGAHSLRPATLQTLFVGLASGVRPLRVISIFTERAKPKMRQGMESRTGTDKWV